MKIIDVRNKELKWYNRNCFYVVTILYLVAVCITHFLLEKQIDSVVEKYEILNILLVPFRHNSVGHIIGNTLSFFIISLFLERHFGSIQYLLIIILSVPISSSAVFMIRQGFIGQGASGVNFFLYGLLFVTIIFKFKEYILTPKQNIFSIIIIVLTILLMCWDGNSANLSESVLAFFKFGFFPSLLNNSAHWATFIMGIIVTIFANIYAISCNSLTKGINKKENIKSEIPETKSVQTENQKESN